jgi:hypothetical protein
MKMNVIVVGKAENEMTAKEYTQYLGKRMIEAVRPVDTHLNIEQMTKLAFKQVYRYEMQRNLAFAEIIKEEMLFLEKNVLVAPDNWRERGMTVQQWTFNPFMKCSDGNYPGYPKVKEEWDYEFYTRLHLMARNRMKGKKVAFNVHVPPLVKLRMEGMSNLYHTTWSAFANWAIIKHLGGWETQTPSDKTYHDYIKNITGRYNGPNVDFYNRVTGHRLYESLSTTRKV